MTTPIISIFVSQIILIIAYYTLYLKYERYRDYFKTTCIDELETEMLRSFAKATPAHLPMLVEMYCVEEIKLPRVNVMRPEEKYIYAYKRKAHFIKFANINSSTWL